MTGKQKGYLALAITSTVWGLTWVVSKLAIRHLPALQMAGIRQFIAGILFIAYFFIFKKEALPTARQFAWLALMAVLMFVFANGLSTEGIRYIPSGMGALIGSLYPLNVVLIQFLFFKKRNFNALTYLGLFLGIAGTVIMFIDHDFSADNAHFTLGLILSVIAMVSWSLGTVLLSRNKVNINPYYGTGWQMIISSGIIACYTLLSGNYIPLTSIPAAGWFYILVLALGGSIIAFVAFIYSMKVLQPSIASLYAYINPVVAMLVAAVLIPEPLTFHLFWGGLVILSGVYLVNRSIRRKQSLTEPEM